MITECYDNETEAIISLKDFYGERQHIVDVCLIVFSKDIHAHLLDTYNCEIIGMLTACNGDTPIYKMNYKDMEIAFYLSSIGSAIASAECIEVNWVTGATTFIMFGSCGSLEKKKTEGKFIVPTESYRGEGCSYYYTKPSNYIIIKNGYKVSKIFEELKIPHVTGKVWTTDSMVRETAGLVARRKDEGCIAVEMELAGVQSVCDFYGFELFDFLEAGDVLEASGYEVEGLQLANHGLGKLYIALELALRI